MSNQYYLKWNPNSHQIINFFARFPVKNQTDRELLDCDLNLLQSAVQFFTSQEHQLAFAEQYIKSRKDLSWISFEFRDKVTIPYSFFKGLFHRWGEECLTGIRLGNPKNPSYKFSYEIPQVRTYTIIDAFSKGAIPCPNCFQNELSEIFEVPRDQDDLA
jgi:hypothetical protein